MDNRKLLDLVSKFANSKPVSGKDSKAFKAEGDALQMIEEMANTQASQSPGQWIYTSIIKLVNSYYDAREKILRSRDPDDIHSNEQSDAQHIKNTFFFFVQQYRQSQLSELMKSPPSSNFSLSLLVFPEVSRVLDAKSPNERFDVLIDLCRDKKFIQMLKDNQREASTFLRMSVDNDPKLQSKLQKSLGKNFKIEAPIYTPAASPKVAPESQAPLKIEKKKENIQANPYPNKSIFEQLSGVINDDLLPSIKQQIKANPSLLNAQSPESHASTLLISVLFLASKTPNFHEQEKYLNFAKFLISQPGINLNIQDKAGNTALHRAAWYGFTEVAQSLIQKGADPRLRNGNQETVSHNIENGALRNRSGEKGDLLNLCKNKVNQMQAEAANKNPVQNMNDAGPQPPSYPAFKK